VSFASESFFLNVISRIDHSRYLFVVVVVVAVVAARVNLVYICSLDQLTAVSC